MKVRANQVVSAGHYLYTHCYWWCPGCDSAHVWAFKEQLSDYQVPEWEWNGDTEKPTVRPSILTNDSRPDKRCHVFINDGVIDYLGDCWHELKGQKVPMVDLPDWLTN